MGNSASLSSLRNVLCTVSALRMPASSNNVGLTWFNSGFSKLASWEPFLRPVGRRCQGKLPLGWGHTSVHGDHRSHWGWGPTIRNSLPTALMTNNLFPRLTEYLSSSIESCTITKCCPFENGGMILKKKRLEFFCVYWNAMYISGLGKYYLRALP